MKGRADPENRKTCFIDQSHTILGWIANVIPVPSCRRSSHVARDYESLDLPAMTEPRDKKRERETLLGQVASYDFTP